MKRRLALLALFWAAAAGASAGTTNALNLSPSGSEAVQPVRRLLVNPRADSSVVKSLDTSDAFWVFGNDGVHVYNADGTLLHHAQRDTMCSRYETCPRGTASGSPSCTWSNDCNWGDVVSDGSQYVMATNTENDKLVVFDMKTGMLVASIPTCGFPYYIDLAEWRSEAYVHCWYPDSDDSGVIDVFSTSAWSLKHPQIMASFNPTGQGHGHVILDSAVPNWAYATNLADPGVHKLDVNKHTDLMFINLTSSGCSSAGSMVVSSKSLHGYLQCYRSDFSSFLLELNLLTDTVVHAHTAVSGEPVVTPDGAMILVRNAGTGVLHTLRVTAPGQPADDIGIADIPTGFIAGGFNRIAFGGEPPHMVAVMTSTADNYVLVLNLADMSTSTITLPGSPTDANSTSLQGHGASREVAVGMAANGQLYAMVAASRLKWAHLLHVGTSAASSRVAATLEGLDVSRVLFVPHVRAASALAQEEQQEGSGSSGGDSAYEGVAVAALVLAVVAVMMAAAAVGMLFVASRRSGAASSSLPCVTPAEPLAYKLHEGEVTSKQVGLV